MRNRIKRAASVAALALLVLATAGAGCPVLDRICDRNPDAPLCGGGDTNPRDSVRG